MIQTIQYKVCDSKIEAYRDEERKTVTISLLTQYDTLIARTKLKLEVPFQIFEELINNISKLSKRQEVEPEEISDKSIEEIADKAGYVYYNGERIAHTIAAVLNTDIKLIKKKKYKVLLKLQKQVDKQVEQEVLAVSHEDAFNKAHEKAKHDWPLYKIVDTKSEET